MSSTRWTWGFGTHNRNQVHSGTTVSDAVKLSQTAIVPTQDRNTIDAMKGLCITYVQRQSTAFEEFILKMNDLRNQIELVSPELWPRRVNQSLPEFREQLDRGIGNAVEAAVVMITSLPESQQNLASEIWEQGLNIIAEFASESLATAAGMTIAALSNHSAPKWTMILQTRVYVSQQYAKAVIGIDNIQPANQTPYAKVYPQVSARVR